MSKNHEKLLNPMANQQIRITVIKSFTPSKMKKKNNLKYFNTSVDKYFDHWDLAMLESPYEVKL